MSPLTALTAGGVTRTDVTITNESGHTLSNAHFLVGLDQVTLPTDVKVVAVFNGNAASCPTISDPVSTLDCNFGNIGAKANQKTRSLQPRVQRRERRVARHLGRAEGLGDRLGRRLQHELPNRHGEHHTGCCELRLAGDLPAAPGSARR